MKLGELLIEVQDQELTEQQEEQIRKYLGIKKNKKWKPKNRDKYYYIDSYGYVVDKMFIEEIPDVYRLSINNCFKTEEEAEFRLEQIKVYYELKNFADENNDDIDWNDDEFKYHICNKYTDETASNRYIGINPAIVTQSIGEIYFSSEKIAHQALAKVGVDRIKKYLFEVEENE